MRMFRCLVAGFAAAFALAAHAGSSTDVWFDPAEPGWGMNVVHQAEGAFVTLFVHGRDGKPTWYVSPDARIVALSGVDGSPLFQGTLYRTEGTWHGGAWRAQDARSAAIGDIFLEVQDQERMRLDYTVDGVATSKIVTRFSFERPPVTGGYTAQLRLRQARVGLPPGVVVVVSGELLVDADSRPGRISATLRDHAGRTCTLAGTAMPTGRLLRADGTYTCDVGDTLAGTFALSEVEGDAQGITGRLRLEGDGLTLEGPFAGARWAATP